MVNKHRGDTPVKVGTGEDAQELVLCYDLNACAMVMEELGIDNMEDLADPSKLNEKLSIGTLIYILWAGLQRHHPDLEKQEVGAMEWDLEGAGEVIGKAFTRGLMRNKKPSRSGGTSSKKARRGTGRK